MCAARSLFQFHRLHPPFFLPPTVHSCLSPFLKSIYNPSSFSPRCPLSFLSFRLSQSSVACKHRHLAIRGKFTFNMSRKKKLLKHQNLIHLPLLQKMEQVVCLCICVCVCVCVCVRAWGMLSLFTDLVNSFHNAFFFFFRWFTLRLAGSLHPHKNTKA